MMLHIGERVYWGAPEVIYLEGTVNALNEKEQTVIIHIERATPHSAHLIGLNMAFAADGVMSLKGATPPGMVSERSAGHQGPPPALSDEEKIRSAASVAVHQQYGYELPKEREQALIEQVAQVLNSDPHMRTKIIASMNEILQREP